MSLLKKQLLSLPCHFQPLGQPASQPTDRAPNGADDNRRRDNNAGETVKRQPVALAGRRQEFGLAAATERVVWLWRRWK